LREFERKNLEKGDTSLDDKKLAVMMDRRVNTDNYEYLEDRS
jgi:hypothetical protein